MRKKRRSPGERAGLERQVVLEAAREISEKEGIRGLTMRHLAQKLGVAPNALYSHFADKSELLDALLDSLLSEIEVFDLGALEWKAGLLELMLRSRRTLLAHAELIPVLLARPPQGPNAQHLGVVTYDLLARGKVQGAAAEEALRVLLIFTFGFVAQEGPEGWMRAANSARGDTIFETGLRWLIDGIGRDSEGSPAIARS